MRQRLSLLEAFTAGVLATFSVVVVFQSSPQMAVVIEDKFITSDTKKDLESELVTNDQKKDPSESSMDEISARLAWVESGRLLPAEARRRTILRANNSKPDLIGFAWKKEDVGPTKRHLSQLIVEKDDRNRVAENQKQ